VPGFTVGSTFKTATLFDCVNVKPEVVGVPVKVKVLIPVPPDAVNVSKATIPDVVVILPTVKVSWTGGLMVIAYTFDVVASAESVAVTVS
jgi:hypothetical protein